MCYVLIYDIDKHTRNEYFVPDVSVITGSIDKYVVYNLQQYSKTYCCKCTY